MENPVEIWWAGERQQLLPIISSRAPPGANWSVPGAILDAKCAYVQERSACEGKFGG